MPTTTSVVTLSAEATMSSSSKDRTVGGRGSLGRRTKQTGAAAAHCLPLTATAERGLPIKATNDAGVIAAGDGVLKAAAAGEVCLLKQPMTQLCPLDELFTPDGNC